MTFSRAVLVTLLALAAPSAASGQSCGGTERWAVKVGADPGAAQVNLTPVGTTLFNLVRLTKPTIPADDATRTSAERTVFVVDARLMQFKRESGKSGDSDYHLVISDETGLFSSGAVGSVASLHSFVAEIPDPGCVGGENGLVASPSRFATQMQSMVTKFRQQFPNVIAGWNDAAGIPVRLTGVAFFDRDHRQVGRAPNGLELHPLLDIAFNPTGPLAGVTPTAVTTVSLANAGFEQGAQGWSTTPDVISSSSEQSARTGQWKAWLGGYGATHTDRLAQSVTLPSSGSGALSFYLHIDTEEGNTQQFDKLRVRVRDASGSIGTLLATLKTFSNLDAAPGFALRTVDLSAYRGQTIRISFEAVEDNGSTTSFVIDDVKLTITP